MRQEPSKVKRSSNCYHLLYGIHRAYPKLTIESIRTVMKHGLNRYLNDELLDYLSLLIPLNTTLVLSLLTHGILPTSNPAETAEKF